MKKVVVIEGEDAAPEAIRPTVALIDRFGLDLQWSYPAIGEGDEPFPDESRRAIDESDATLFGAASGMSALALFYLRWGKETYANVRPARWFPGCRSPLADPRGIDMVIVRENLEDLYVGIEGKLETLAPLGLVSPMIGVSPDQLAPGRFALKVITERGSRRIIRFAFELARRRKALGRPGKLTCSSKYNMLPRTDGMFRHIAEEIATDYPDIELETLIIDDFAHRMVIAPQRFDVVVMPNLYGDILSDAAAGMIGGLGLGPSGCYGENYAYFESIHGTAPDIAGRNWINPTATILSAAMMLEHLEFTEAAQRLVGAVERVYSKGEKLTRDQGGSAGTDEFCEAVACEMQR
jgi:isocitrate/isopropylmalate dehydrogenase